MRRYLVAQFDVTALNDEQLDALTGEVVCQGEPTREGIESAGHPNVKVATELVNFVPPTQCVHGESLGIFCWGCEANLSDEGRECERGEVSMRYVVDESGPKP